MEEEGRKLPGGRRHLGHDGIRAGPNFLFGVLRLRKDRRGNDMGESSGDESDLEEEMGEREDSALASQLLDSVLSSLYDFGESVPDGRRKKKKNSSREATAPMAIKTLSAVTPESGALSSGKRKNVSSFFDDLKDELAKDQKRCVSGSSFPEASLLKPAQQEKATQIEVVTFHGHPRKKKIKLETNGCDDSKAKVAAEEPSKDVQEFNLEKARLEVHRLGITGFTKKEQQILEQERAIMLGAKPPKKEYVNYKILQEKIREKQAAKKNENMVLQESKSDSLKRRKKRGHEERRSRKTTKQNRLTTGQMGTFKNGTLILRSCDIRKIKSSKMIK